MKNSLERFRGRFEQAEERLSERQYGKMENIKSERRKKRLKKSEQSLRDWWDTITQQHTHTGHLKREKRDKGEERLFKEITGPNSPNVMKDMDINEKLNEIHAE